MGTGKKKIEMKKIENVNNRRVAFSKRKKGLFTKAAELSALTGCQVAVITFSSAMTPFLFGSVSLLENAAAVGAGFQIPNAPVLNPNFEIGSNATGASVGFNNTNPNFEIENAATTGSVGLNCINSNFGVSFSSTNFETESAATFGCKNVTSPNFQINNLGNNSSTSPNSDFGSSNIGVSVSSFVLENPYITNSRFCSNTTSPDLEISNFGSNCSTSPNYELFGSCDFGVECSSTVGDLDSYITSLDFEDGSCTDFIGLGDEEVLFTAEGLAEVAELMGFDRS